MRAMVLDAPASPLRLADLPQPECGDDGVLIKVGACGVCRTDLHILDGPYLWHCAYCTSGRENLCDEARFTGYT